MMKALKKKNVDMNKALTPGSNSGATPFWAACYNGKLEAVKLLILWKVDSVKCTENGVSP